MQQGIDGRGKGEGEIRKMITEKLVRNKKKEVKEGGGDMLRET